jgi:hypothetical protein
VAFRQKRCRFWKINSNIAPRHPTRHSADPTKKARSPAQNNLVFQDLHDFAVVFRRTKKQKAPVAAGAFQKNKGFVMLDNTSIHHPPAGVNHPGNNFRGAKELAQAITYFFAPGETFELCLIGPRNKKHPLWDNDFVAAGAGKKGIVAGWFDDPTRAAQIAAQADAQTGPEGIYVTLNPVNPALLGRANNRLKAGAARTNDTEITCLRHLLIDADPTRPAGVSSSEAEHAAALRLLGLIRTHLGNLGWPDPLFADSGNGGHLIYRLPDLANTPEHIDLLKSCLQALADQYDTPQIQIDKKVFNPARISKAYGTHARKGDSTPDRPHRLAQILDAPTKPTPVPMDLLHALAALAPKTEPKSQPQHRPGSASFNGESRPLDVPAYLSRYGRTMLKEKLHGTSTLFVLDECVFNPDHRGGDAAIGQTADGKLFYQCYHNSCHGRTWLEARQTISGDDPLFLKKENKQTTPARTPETYRPEVLSSSSKHQYILNTATRVIEEDGLLKLIKYDNKTEMEVSKIVASFKIEPFESIYIEGEGQYIKASFQNCKKRRDVILTPDCWTSSQKFLKILPDAEFSFTGNIETVQLVKRHVAQFDLEQKNGTRTAGFHSSDAGELQFITEHGALTASGSRTDLVYLNEVPSGCALQQHSPLTPDQTHNLDRLLAFNAGEVTLPLLGWTAAAFFKERIHATHSCFPLLNIEGEAGAGKSSTAREVLMRLWGITTAPRAIAEQTKFTMMRQVSSSNAIPLVYEENKSTKMNEKQVQMVSNLIRDTYNSFEGQRGFADQSMRTYRYDAPVCIIGETGFNESAILDRIVTVSLSRNTSQHYLSTFKQLKHLPLENLGRALLDHSLTTDQAAVAAGIEAELALVDQKLTDRPRLNAAILRFGLRTLLRLLGMADQFGEEEFALIDRSVLTTTTDDEGPSRKSAVDRVLEHMARMATRAVPQEGATKQLSEICLEHGVHYQIKDGFIRLWVSGAYPEFQRWAKHYGYSDDVLPEATFKKQIKSANYYVENKAAEIGAKVRKCYILRLDSMTNAGIDVDFYY